MRSIEKLHGGLWVACFPYFSLGAIRQAVADSLGSRWMILPVKGDKKAAELYQQKLVDYGIDARPAYTASAAVAVPGGQVPKLVEYGVAKLKQNMVGLPWGPDDFDREWLDASQLPSGKRIRSVSWKISVDTAEGAPAMKRLHKRYGTTTAFVHDEDGSWTVVYTFDDGMLLGVAGDLPNLGQWMECALKMTAGRRGMTVSEIVNCHSGLCCDDRVWHGFPCFSRTRVPVHAVLEFLKAGLSERDILNRLPYLRQTDLQAARSFVTDLSTDLKMLPRGLEAKLESFA